MTQKYWENIYIKIRTSVQNHAWFSILQIYHFKVIFFKIDKGWVGQGDIIKEH